MANNLGTIYYDIGVNTSKLVGAGKTISDFQSNTDRAFKKTGRTIKRTESTMERFARNTKNSFDRVSSSSHTLRNALVAVASTETIRRTALVADTYQVMGDKIKIATGQVNGNIKVMDRLTTAAVGAGAGLNEVISGFQRMSFAKETVDATTEDMVGLTEAMFDLALVSGTQGPELGSAMVQFSQGLISGTFQAQEFQSVLEAIPAINEHIAAGMGISTDQVINLKKEGKLLSKEVFQALLSQTDEIAKRAEGIPPRLGRAWKGFTTTLGVSLGKMNEASKSTELIAKMFIDLTSKTERLPTIMFALAKSVKRISNENKGFVEFVEVLVKTRVAIFGIGIALSLVLGVFTKLVTKTNAVALALGVIITHWDDLNRIADDKGIKLFDADLWEQQKKGLSNTGKSIAGVVKNLLGFSIGAKSVDEVTDALARSREAFSSVYDVGITAPPEHVGPTQTPSVPGVSPEDENNAQEKLSFIEQFKLDMLASEQMFRDMELEDLAKGEAEKARLEKEAREKQLIEEQKHWIKRTEGYRKFEKGILNLKEQFARFKDDSDKKKHASTLAADTKNFKDQIGLAAESSKIFFDINKAFAISDILMKTPQAIASAINWGMSHGGPPVAAVAGTLAGASMGVQLAAVSSQSFTPRAIGGDVFPNQQYKVNENGPELFSSGGSDFLLTGSSRGSITPAGRTSGTMSKSGGSGDTIINIITPEGTEARSEEREENGEQITDIFIEMVDQGLASNIQSGISQTGNVLESLFGLNRAQGASF